MKFNNNLPLTFYRSLRILLELLELDPASACGVPGAPGEEQEQDDDDGVRDQEASEDAPCCIGDVLPIVR